MEELKRKTLPTIFLDVGHAFGSKTGAACKAIQEEVYNRKIRDWVYSLWEKRVLVDQLLAAIPGALLSLVNLGVFRSTPYILAESNEDPPYLYGSYKEKAAQAQMIGVTHHIQMHLNAGGGKYAIVGYKESGPHAAASQKMAEIFAECLQEEYDRFPGLISKIRVDACGRASSEPLRRRIYYCLEHFECPSILIEPFFLDYDPHNEHLKTGQGFGSLAQAYLKAMERIALEVTNETDSE